MTERPCKLLYGHVVCCIYNYVYPCHLLHIPMYLGNLKQVPEQQPSKGALDVWSACQSRSVSLQSESFSYCSLPVHKCALLSSGSHLSTCALVKTRCLELSSPIVRIHIISIQSPVLTTAYMGVAQHSLPRISLYPGSYRYFARVFDTIWNSPSSYNMCPLLEIGD